MSNPEQPEGQADRRTDGHALGVQPEQGCTHQPLDLYERIIMTEAGQGLIGATMDAYPQPACGCNPLVSVLRTGRRPAMHRVLGTTAALHAVHPLAWCYDRTPHQDQS